MTIFNPSNLYADICNELPKDSTKDHPSEFGDLSSAKQDALVYWIRNAMVGSNSYCRRDTYGIKHDFEAEGFYVSNGEFKGAMLVCGYRPKIVTAQNWTFRIRPVFMRKAASNSDLPQAREDYRISLGRFDVDFARLLKVTGEVTI